MFENDGNITKAIKSNLVTELEKTLQPSDYVTQDKWDQLQTACLVDVMANIRGIEMKKHENYGSFGDGFLNMIRSRACSATRMDFIFDTYVAGSVKDAERLRRTKTTPIDIHSIAANVPLPKNLNTFWPSSSNKTMLQVFFKEHIISEANTKFPHATVVMSGTGGDAPTPAVSFQNSIVQLPELCYDIEEADLRIIPHAMHAARAGYKRIVVLSSDTDVLVLLIYYWNVLNEQGLEEVWIRAGVGNSVRHIPVHTLCAKLGSDVCRILPSVHAISGCDNTSKVGTKSAALKANPVMYLTGFGRSANYGEECSANAESYIVQLFKKDSQFKTLDELRYWLYHHSKATSLQDLPPTSREITSHIRRAFYITHMYTTCLETPSKLDPLQYGYEYSLDGLLLPSNDRKILPDDLILGCKCKKCARQSCECKRNAIPCISFCKCQAVLPENIDCQNTHID